MSLSLQEGHGKRIKHDRPIAHLLNWLAKPMKPYLISKEVLARQVYRYHPAYRFAAFVFFCFLTDSDTCGRLVCL